jgi:hypothetical protein
MISMTRPVIGSSRRTGPCPGFRAFRRKMASVRGWSFTESPSIEFPFLAGESLAKQPLQAELGREGWLGDSAP